MSKLNFICFKRLVFVVLMFTVYHSNAQSARGFYIGYQAACVPGGMNNLRAMVGHHNSKFYDATKEMKYANLLHGISAGFIIRKKSGSYSLSNFSKKPFFEINWNSLHNKFTAEGTLNQGDAEKTQSIYKVKFNSLGLLMGLQLSERLTFKTGLQSSNFVIKFRSELASKFESSKYRDVTDPGGFPTPNFHFSADYGLSQGAFVRFFFNLPINIEKENGYLYNLTNAGINFFITLNKNK